MESAAQAPYIAGWPRRIHCRAGSQKSSRPPRNVELYIPLVGRASRARISIGVRQIHARGPRSSGVNAPHMRVPVRLETTNAPAMPAGADRADAMISAGVA